jgi:formylmethanofuran dehydrogenase subunit E
MIFTDDPLEDFARYDTEQYNKLQRLPKCLECKEPIQTEVAYKFNKGLVCENCMELRKVFMD